MRVMLPPVRLDHCVIHVSDWEVSNAFYRDVVGAELVETDGRTAYRFGSQQLNLHGPGVSPAPVARLPVQPGNSDLCFAWDGPIEDAVAISSPAGWPSSSARSTVPARAGRVAASTSATPTAACSSSSPTRSDSGQTRFGAAPQHQRTPASESSRINRITPAATVASGIGGGMVARSSAVTRSVATQSGTMQLTRTPSTAASAEVNRMSPAFAAPYWATGTARSPSPRWRRR